MKYRKVLWEQQGHTIADWRSKTDVELDLWLAKHNCKPASSKQPSASASTASSGALEPNIMIQDFGAENTGTLTIALQQSNAGYLMESSNDDDAGVTKTAGKSRVGKSRKAPNHNFAKNNKSKTMTRMQRNTNAWAKDQSTTTRGNGRAFGMSIINGHDGPIVAVSHIDPALGKFGTVRRAFEAFASQFQPLSPTSRDNLVLDSHGSPEISTKPTSAAIIRPVTPVPKPPENLQNHANLHAHRDSGAKYSSRFAKQRKHRGHFAAKKSLSTSLTSITNVPTDTIEPTTISHTTAQ